MGFHREISKGAKFVPGEGGGGSGGGGGGRGDDILVRPTPKASGPRYGRKHRV